MSYNKTTPVEREKIKEEKKREYLKKFRIWKFTIIEWIAIVLILFFVGFLLLALLS